MSANAQTASTLYYQNSTSGTWGPTYVPISSANPLPIYFPGGGGGGPTTNQNIREVVIGFDGGGNPLSGSLTRCRTVEFSGTINAVNIVSDVSGAATVDIQTVAYSSYTGPSSASSITASDIPALSSALKYSDTTLTGWTKTLTSPVVVCGVLSSPSTVTWLNLTLKIAAN